MISCGGWKRESLIGNRSALKSGKPYHVLGRNLRNVSGSSFTGREPRISMPLLVKKRLAYSLNARPRGRRMPCASTRRSPPPGLTEKIALVGLSVIDLGTRVWLPSPNGWNGAVTAMSFPPNRPASGFFVSKR
jgi:hypothetical protein